MLEVLCFWQRRLDVPKAPKLLGSLVGSAMAEGALPAGKLADLYEKVEDTETRRRGVADALLYTKVGTRFHEALASRAWISCTQDKSQSLSYVMRMIALRSVT
jgi:hypothetical protein